MDKKIKKSIAREGLIFIPYFTGAWLFSYGKAFRPAKIHEYLYDIDTGSFLEYMFTFVSIYLAIRFIVWAIMTLREQ